jgi:hypothetical protein
MTAEAEVIDGEAVEIVEPGKELELRPDAGAVSLFGTNDPGEVLLRATQTAKPLAEVIKRQQLFKTISGKNHIYVEGWTLLGSMLGVFPATVWTRKLDNGWEARVEARTRSGELVGAAEAMCTRAEVKWKSSDEYAIRSMAQTRATSKALRQPLGFVIQLAGFEPTPAEEAEAGAPVEPKAKPKTDEIPEGFKAPTGPRGGQSTALEANELAANLVSLVTELGATDSLDAIEAKREAGDIPWLKRQTTAAERHLEGKKASS